MLITSSANCVIPQPLDIESSNTPPVIDIGQTAPDPSVPVPVFRTGEQATEPVKTNFTVYYVDPDREDAVLRTFVDGAPYDSFVDEISDGYSSSPLRAANVQLEGLCDPPRSSSERFTLEIYVTDTEFVTSGTDLRKTTVVDGHKGGRDNVMWTIECNLPLPILEF